MFQRKRARPQQKRIDSLIGAGTTVRGDISFGGGLRIDGSVTGKVVSIENETATLVISEHAKIDGEVRVTHVVVNGLVNGPITSSDYLELQAKAKVLGDVVYRTLEMHVGAVVQGKLAPMDQEVPAAPAAVVGLKRVGSA